MAANAFFLYSSIGFTYGLSNLDTGMLFIYEGTLL
jgi:hypothetical protein